MTKDKEIIFGVDVDEVLRELLDSMIYIYNREFETDKKKEDVLDFRVDESFPLVKERLGISASEWFFQSWGHVLFTKSNLIAGAKSAIDELRKVGKVIIITYQRTLMNKTDTISWLWSNGIEYDGICFTKDKTFIHCDYFIDDNDWNFEGCNSTHGVLIDAPYNVNCDIDELLVKSNCEDIIRMHSLKDFAKWYKENRVNE